MNGMELKELLDTVSEKVRKETAECYIYCTQEKYKKKVSAGKNLRGG